MPQILNLQFKIPGLAHSANETIQIGSDIVSLAHSSNETIPICSDIVAKQVCKK